MILNIAHPQIGVAALNLVGVVNKNGFGHKNFCTCFARGLFSTPLYEILDTPLGLTHQGSLCDLLLVLSQSQRQYESDTVHNGVHGHEDHDQVTMAR